MVRAVHLLEQLQGELTANADQQRLRWIPPSFAAYLPAWLATLRNCATSAPTKVSATISPNV
ncbi:hypothetical protein TV39_13345 [Arthrobacter sp. SPG23]|nr:hypothetical protein TV39_13345 [Arthrobacter sp. SPG23]